jgi:type VI secretion system (T6SS) immunity protein Tdi1
MALKDITLPTAGIDWEKVLQEWSWILKDHPEFNVWMLTRFADLFVRLPDDSIWWLESGSGTFERVADTKLQFAQILNQPERLAQWFMPALIEELEAAGMVLGEKQCYGFKIPPGLGGKFVISNIKVTDIENYFLALGGIWHLLREVPDGTTVRLELKD